MIIKNFWLNFLVPLALLVFAYAPVHANSVVRKEEPVTTSLPACASGQIRIALHDRSSFDTKTGAYPDERFECIDLPHCPKDTTVFYHRAADKLECIHVPTCKAPEYLSYNRDTKQMECFAMPRCDTYRTTGIAETLGYNPTTDKAECMRQEQVKPECYASDKNCYGPHRVQLTGYAIGLNIPQTFDDDAHGPWVQVVPTCADGKTLKRWNYGGDFECLPKSSTDVACGPAKGKGTNTLPTQGLCTNTSPPGGEPVSDPIKSPIAVGWVWMCKGPSEGTSYDVTINCWAPLSNMMSR